MEIDKTWGKHVSEIYLYLKDNNPKLAEAFAEVLSEIVSDYLAADEKIWHFNKTYSQMGEHVDTSKSAFAAFSEPVSRSEDN
jgi:hypothetical protein